MVDSTYFLALFLIFLRLTSYFIVVDVFFPSGTPKVLKGVLGIIIAYGIIGGVDASVVNSINSNYLLIFSAVSEILSGLILGFLTNIIFLSVKFAGGWMDIHAGFSMVSVLDPTTQMNSTLLGNFSYMIAMMIFFIVDGQEIVLGLLAKSFEIVPLGHTIVYSETLSAIIKTIFHFFALGMEIAIPVVLIIVMIDVCLGLISRTVPTIPIMIFGMPIKNALGLVTFLIIMPLITKIVSSAIYGLPQLFENLVKVIPAAGFMCIFADADKTEEATPKKLSDARKKGQLPRSKDVNVAITMLACTLLILVLWDSLTNGFKDVIIYFLRLPALNNFNIHTLGYLSLFVIYKTAVILLPFALSIMVAGVFASFLQTGFLLTKEPIKPSLGKLNPISGFKNMFSKKSIVDLLKNSIVITIVTLIAYKYIKKNYLNILNLVNLYLPDMGIQIRNLVVGIFSQICIVLVVIAAIDYFLQRKMFSKDMKMTKQEIKDEYKEQEGDPQIKGKIKQKQREISRRRMMNAVADATVVVTNPTHIAIALKYEEKGKMEAPKVVAKGADYIALKIKEKAKENDVPIVENKPLARLMYKQVELNKEIPEDMYQAVAEILAVVMKIKK
ncbi:fused FliR family export protein/FlhB family type III secretion system protein [Clostridium sp. BJN0001]|uniref:fused FliR family export protein/FlhB family type III secretion system protein n=1 Tax=Clostridium sp. BJN0001 TaxID=2930219 RepID=UPI001FD430F6|nr:fused FliR family export protein/FlhB family type III secretion system protein [Clostridium sp. BJN0001]